MGALSKSAKAESRLDICPPAYLICLASNVMRKRTRCGRIASIFFVDRSERDSSSKARNDIEFTAGSICYGLLATSRKPERGARGGGLTGRSCGANLTRRPSLLRFSTFWTCCRAALWYSGSGRSLEKDSGKSKSTAAQWSMALDPWGGGGVPNSCRQEAGCREWSSSWGERCWGWWEEEQEV